MTAKTISLPRRLAVPVASFLLIACLGGKEDEKTIASYVESIEIDHDNQALWTSEVYWYCDDGEPDFDVEEWRQSYAIDGGVLYRWTYGDCRARTSRGSSPDIIGVWTADPVELADIPGESRYCDEGALADEELFNGFGRNLSVREEIFETQIHGTLTGEFCGADMYAWLVRFDMAQDYQDFAITAENCSSAEITRQSDGRVGRFTSRHVAGGAIKMTFTTQGHSCSATIPLDDSEERDCSKPDPVDAFPDCIGQTGFFGGQNLLAKGGRAEFKRRAWRAARARP